MHGASISRWTMAYFVAALACLLVALALIGSGFGLPTDVTDAPETLAVVHLIAIGWLGLLFCGALLQFVPVLAATNLKLPGLAGPALVLLISGLALLVSGFLALGGHVAYDPAIVSAGGGILAVGFGLLAVSLGSTVVLQGDLSLAGVLVVAGLVALLATVAMGNLLAGLLSGVIDLPSIASRLSELVPYHAASGVLGWMTLTAIGVSYKLFAMFLLAPEGGAGHRRIVISAGAALAGLLLAFGLALWGSAYAGVAAGAAFVAAATLSGLYAHDVWRMFAARRRKALELNFVAGLAALGFLFAGLVLLGFAVASDVDLPFGAAAVYVLGIGWLSGLGLSQLYKIVPFLTWLETYGPVMGCTPVPRVQDLVDERHARRLFVVFFLAVCAGSVAILFGFDLLLRAASWAQCAAVAGLSLEYLRARRLAYAPDRLRLPPGTVRPHLIYANTSSKE